MDYVNLTLYGSTYTVTPHFSKYVDNGRTALFFTEDGIPAFDGSVNIPHAYVPNNDFLVVKNYAENEGLADELIRLELIEETPISHVQSGFVTLPIHKLTEKAIRLRDEQFAEQGV